MRHKSDLALAAATRWPRLGSWAVRLWWRREQSRHPSKRHRLFEAMKDRTKTPLRKLFILPAGQKFLADPFCYVGSQLEYSFRIRARDGRDIPGIGPAGNDRRRYRREPRPPHAHPGGSCREDWLCARV